MVVVVSLKAADRATCSDSKLDKAILVWIFYFQIMKDPACLITNHVRECADAGSSAIVVLNQPAKPVSTNTSKPLSMLSSCVKP